MGGDLVIRGTRIPIEEVLYLLVEQGKSVADIHELYPWVAARLLQGAINEKLTREKLLRATRHAMNLPPVDVPEWKTAESTSQWVHDLRVESDRTRNV